MTRLSARFALPPNVAVPQYNPREYGAGIIHLGPGVFHRSHLAYYTDEALAAQGGDWRIIGVGLRSNSAAKELNPQDGLYTLLEKDASGTHPRVIGSISRVLTVPKALDAVLEWLAAPETRIVSLTITEKGYGLNRASGGVDTSNPAIAADLSTPERPRSAIGLIIRGLLLRRQRGVPPFTVLCCDNLPENGTMLRRACTDFARHIDPHLADWIESEVAFPSTMVDRITPAQTDATLQEAESLIGCCDQAAVVTESFLQWIIEDDFPLGRPAWDAAGALFVEDVKLFEDMKLRMLNGTHTLLAYCGFPACFDHVRDTMDVPALRALARRHLRAAANTLTHPKGIDLEQYAEQLLARFSNPAIAHETYQIAMDGTEKLPQRILAPAAWALEHGHDIRPFAFAVAAWMHYCSGRRDDGQAYDLRDPREEIIRRLLRNSKTPAERMHQLHSLSDVFSPQLTANPSWQNAVLDCLICFTENGSANAARAEARRTSI